MSPRTAFLTALALLCFAGNSLLCRLALADGLIDAAAFTAVRLVSGAALLALLTARRPSGATEENRWLSALALIAYAAPFSFAYLRLGAATGALILFGTVQAVMIGWGLFHGERLGALGWAGLMLALGGLVGLTVKGQGAPDPLGAASMALAGLAWGAYSLRGRSTPGDPLAATAAAFLRAVPFAIALLAVPLARAELHVTPRGLALAVASGAIASGLGYAVWYAALRQLTATRAALLQLLVPALAALGGVLVLSESLTTRFLLSGTAIVAGVALSLSDRRKATA